MTTSPIISNAQRLAVNYEITQLTDDLGNLRLEHVFDLRGREHILNHLILDQDLFHMPSGPYGVLTARDSITDHYAVEAERKGISPSQFATRLEGIVGSSKDNYDSKLLTNE